MDNKYQKWSHFSDRKFREILRLFLLDIEATKVSSISNISRQAINRIFKYIRIVIADDCEKNTIFDTGEIEVDDFLHSLRKESKVSVVVVREERRLFSDC